MSAVGRIRARLDHIVGSKRKEYALLQFKILEQIKTKQRYSHRSDSRSNSVREKSDRCIKEYNKKLDKLMGMSS